MTIRNIAISCVVAVAALAMLYRDTWLPLWARPEAYRFVTGRFQRIDRNETYLSGYPNLLFSDSQGLSCPWQVDVLFFPSLDPTEILSAFKFHVGDWRYEQIVIWWGTGHFAMHRTVAQYLQVMTPVIAAAKEHSEHIYVIGPMPVHYFEDRNGPTTHTIVEEAVAALRQECPDLPIYDAAQFWGNIDSNGGAGKMLLRDHVHVSPAGFEVIGRSLTTFGFQVPPRRESIDRVLKREAAQTST